MSRMTKLHLVLGKIETVVGEDSLPVPGTDAFLVEDLAPVAPVDPKMYQQAGDGTTYGKGKSLHGGMLYGTSFKILIKGSGAAGTPPRWAPALRVCGVDETIVAVTSVTYNPISPNAAAPHDSGTFYIYEDGKLFELVGCRGNASFVGMAGDFAAFNITLVGHLQAKTDTVLPAATFDSTEPVKIVNWGFSIDGYSAVNDGVTFDLGNALAKPPSVNSTDGFGEIRITDRDITGGINPEDPLLATKDFIDDWESDSEMAMAFSPIGVTAGNIWELDHPRVSPRNVSPGDRDGIRTMALTYEALPTTGDDEFSFVLT